MQQRRPDKSECEAGFTLVEVIVALGVCGVIVAATTPVVSQNLMRARSADGRLQMMLAERRVLDLIPSHQDLRAGAFSGEIDGVAWRADVLPFDEGRAAGAATQWTPYRIRIELTEPGGRNSRIETLRLGAGVAMRCAGPHVDIPGCEEGFSLVEVLAVLLITGLVVSSMTTIAGQSLRSWNRGAANLERVEVLTVAFNRLSIDLEFAVASPAIGAQPLASFLGDERSLRFVRPPVDNAAPPGLEIVGLAAPIAGGVTRSRAAHRPGASIEAAQLGETARLLPEAYSAAFAYLSFDGHWTPQWGGVRLPAAVRITILSPRKDDPMLTHIVSIRATAPAVCARARSWSTCEALAAGAPVGLPQPGGGGQSATARRRLDQ